MKVFILVLSVLIAINCVHSYHFVVGNVADRVVAAHNARVQYNAIPFIKRVKSYFYQGNNKPIQGIQALDQLHSHSSINITAGGVGHTFVNLRLKSDRGTGLDYDLTIYVNPDYF